MKKFTNQGFTVLEAIMAIAVVSLAIAGTTSAVRTGLVSSNIAKEEIQAFYLAQDAVEAIVNKAYANKLAYLNGNLSLNWLSGIANDPVNDPCSPNKICKVEGTGNNLSYCGPNWGDCPALLQDRGTDFYRYFYGYVGGWTQSPFKREIKIEKLNSHEAMIIVSVTWSHTGSPKQFKVNTTITDWF